MKKCPYCAEKIQDAAIVCRYCGRDLPAGKLGKTTATKPGDAKAKKRQSPWRVGAIAAGIVTALYVFSNVSRFLTSPTGTGQAFHARLQDLTFRLTIGLAATFLGFWIISALLVWLWRRIGAGMFLGGMVLIALVAVILLASEALAPPTPPTPTPTARATAIPLLIPTAGPAPTIDCAPVSKVYSGYNGCVYGIVFDVGTVQDSTFFADQVALQGATLERGLGLVINTSPGTPVVRGECVTARGRVSVNRQGTHLFMNATLSRCPADFP
jgi:hypothetical protein